MPTSDTPKTGNGVAVASGDLFGLVAVDPASKPWMVCYYCVTKGDLFQLDGRGIAFHVRCRAIDAMKCEANTQTRRPDYQSPGAERAINAARAYSQQNAESIHPELKP